MVNKSLVASVATSFLLLSAALLIPAGQEDVAYAITTQPTCPTTTNTCEFIEAKSSAGCEVLVGSQTSRSYTVCCGRQLPQQKITGVQKIVYCPVMYKCAGQTSYTYACPPSPGEPEKYCENTTATNIGTCDDGALD